MRNQSAHLVSSLPEFRRLDLSYVSPADLPRTVYQRAVPTARRDLCACDLDFLFRYDVFPPAILKFFGEWQLYGRDMRVGDTIMQQAQVPPGIGIYSVFAVRVLEVRLGADHAGFSYGTLHGHPETGVNAFSFRAEDGRIIARVETTAVPGLALSRLLAPVFTNRYVRFCNRRALARMVQKFSEANA